MICVFIPHWHPATVNQLLRSVKGRIRLKKLDRKIVGDYFGYACKAPRATGKRRVHLIIILKPKQRACDPDSYHKSLLDALKQCGMLLDDNRQHCELAPVLFERSKSWGTVIRLEEIA